MAGVRISREKGLVLRAGALLGNPENQSRIFIHGFQLQLLRKSCHFGQLVWGGAFQDPPRRVRPVGPAYLHTREKDAAFIWIPPFSLRNALICVPGRGGADEEQRRSRGENNLGEQT